jgi:hypothetical protein
VNANPTGIVSAPGGNVTVSVSSDLSFNVTMIGMEAGKTTVTLNATDAGGGEDLGYVMCKFHVFMRVAGQVFFG